MCAGVKLTKGGDGLWRDWTGCVYALTDEASSVDKEVRAGVGPFSMPKDSPVNEAAAPHDYAYSCPAYQMYHNRKEADEKLFADISAMNSWHRHLAWPFYLLCRAFGAMFWERKETR